jgi:hypothetical protein
MLYFIAFCGGFLVAFFNLLLLWDAYQEYRKEKFLEAIEHYEIYSKVNNVLQNRSVSSLWAKL